MAFLILSRFFLKELLYKRVFLVSVFIGLSFVVLGLILGSLSFKEEGRMATNFALAGSQIALIFLSVLVGADFLRSDIESKSVQSFLVRPLSRESYFLSKVLAFAVCLLCLVFIMWCAFILMSNWLQISDLSRAFVPFFGVYIEALVLFSFALLCSLFSSSLLSIGLAFTLFLAGHSAEVFGFLAEKGKTSFGQGFGYVFSKLVPNLESLNWKAHFTYGEWLSWGTYLQYGLYGLFWAALFVCLGVWIFSKKDLA